MANVAAIISAPKSPLEVHEVELYTPGPNELLVRNEVIAFNLVEAKIAKLAVIPLEYPAILGSAFGGTVEAIGSSRYVIVGNNMVSKIPRGMDLTISASLIMNLTSVVGLFSGRIGLNISDLDGSAPSKRNEKVLVFGGSSSFGGLSIQYFSQAGYIVTSTASPKHLDFVSSLGNAKVLNHTLQPDDLVTKLVADGPYYIVLDTVSLPTTISITTQVLAAQGGRKLYATQPAFGPETLPDGLTRVFEPWPDSLYEEKNRELQKWVAETYIPQGILSGAITPLPLEKVAGGLNGINNALDKMLKGTTGVRLVVDPWEE